MNSKKILAKVAPFLGGLVGGPFGATAGQLVGNLLLGNENASESELANAMKNATPEQLAKLKTIDSQERIKMAELAIETQRIDHKDRESARERQKETKDWMPAFLGTTLVAGFFGLVYLLIFVPIPADAKDIMYLLVGTLGSSFIQIMNFYFGSSVSASRTTYSYLPVYEKHTRNCTSIFLNIFF